MRKNYLILGIILLISGAIPVSAETEIGVARHSGWTDDFYLENPEGWGVFIRQSLPPFFALSFSGKQLENSIAYFGTLQFGLVPPDVVPTREIIKAKTTVNIYELSLYHVFVDDERMQLEAGIGGGLADFNLDLAGQSTGTRMSVEQLGLMASFIVSVTIKEFIRSPLALRLGYSHHTISTSSETTDAFEPFNDVTISDIYAVVMLRF